MVLPPSFGWSNIHGEYLQIRWTLQVSFNHEFKESILDFTKEIPVKDPVGMTIDRADKPD